MSEDDLDRVIAEQNMEATKRDMTDDEIPQCTHCGRSFKIFSSECEHCSVETDENKQREFWIYEGDAGRGEYDCVSISEFDGSIHVIEKSAYDAVKAENTQLNKYADETSGRAIELTKEIDRLKHVNWRESRMLKEQITALKAQLEGADKVIEVTKAERDEWHERSKLLEEMVRNQTACTDALKQKESAPINSALSAPIDTGMMSPAEIIKSNIEMQQAWSQEFESHKKALKERDQLRAELEQAKNDLFLERRLPTRLAHDLARIKVGENESLRQKLAVAKEALEKLTKVNWPDKPVSGAELINEAFKKNIEIATAALARLSDEE